MNIDYVESQITCPTTEISAIGQHISQGQLQIVKHFDDQKNQKPNSKDAGFYHNYFKLRKNEVV